MYTHLSSRTLTFFIFNVASFLPLTPRGFVWLHWLGDTFPIFPMWFFGFSYQAAHTFFHCTFWFVGTSSFCWRSSCFGLGWGGPFTRSLLGCGGSAFSFTGFPSFICFNLITATPVAKISHNGFVIILSQQTELAQSETPPTSITFVICKGTWSTKSL